MVNFWKETSILTTQGLNLFYTVRIFDSYVKPRVTYCMTIWFNQNMTSLGKLWWSVHKSIFGIRNYQVSKHVVSVLSNIWPPSLLYTNQVLLFLLSTARSADILNSGNLAIIPQHINMVRLFLVHNFSIVNRDPDEIRAICIHYADNPQSVLLRIRWMCSRRCPSVVCENALLVACEIVSPLVLEWRTP